MHTLHLRNLLGRVALAALLPLALPACDDGGSSDSSGSDSDSDTEGDDDDDDSSATATVTVTDTTPTTMTDSASDGSTTDDSESDTDDTSSDTDDSASDTDATTGDTDATTGETDGTTGETDGTTGETDGTTGNMSECAQLTVSGITTPVTDGFTDYYLMSSVSDIGGDEPDSMRVEFWADVAAGDVDLSMAPNDDYQTCDTCALVLEDIVDGTATRAFFQSQGTLGLSENSSTLTSELTFTGVRLAEYGEDGFVAGGDCIDIVDATAAPLPAEWTCDAAAYQDGMTCDCGCGVVDPDCADAMAGSCDACNGEGSCAEVFADCETITDDDNSSCDPLMGDGYDQTFEAATLAPEFVLGGDADWTLSTAQFQGGAQSIVSGMIDNNGTTDLSLELEFAAPGAITFWSRVSSEEDYDYLRFYINDVEEAGWSGEVDWTEHTYNVPAGTHTFRWSYEKDGSASEGTDNAWIDSITTVGGATTGM